MATAFCPDQLRFSLSESRESLRQFCISCDSTISGNAPWEQVLQSLSAIFRSWDFLCLHHIGDICKLLHLAETFQNLPESPAPLKDQVNFFVRMKLILITDMPENRDFADQLFSARDSLPKSNCFRLFFVKRYIQWEAWYKIMAPFQEVQEANQSQEEAGELVKTNWTACVEQLSEHYKEEEVLHDAEDADFPFPL